MFRRGAMCLVLALGCGSGGPGGSGGGGSGGGGSGGGAADLALSSGSDMAGATTADLLGVPPNGCNSLATCIDNCADDACVALCKSRATANAGSLHDAASQCAEDWCLLGPKDMGVGRCVLDPNMVPIDPPGTPAATCDDCLHDAIAMLAADKTCINPAGSDCNPSVCRSQQMACLADKP